MLDEILSCFFRTFGFNEAICFNIAFEFDLLLPVRCRINKTFKKHALNILPSQYVVEAFCKVSLQDISYLEKALLKGKQI